MINDLTLNSICSKLRYGYAFIQLEISIIWRPPSLSELTPTIINTELTHLGSEASI